MQHYRGRSKKPLNIVHYYSHMTLQCYSVYIMFLIVKKRYDFTFLSRLLWFTSFTTLLVGWYNLLVRVNHIKYIRSKNCQLFYMENKKITSYWILLHVKLNYRLPRIHQILNIKQLKIVCYKLLRITYDYNCYTIKKS